MKVEVTPAARAWLARAGHSHVTVSTAHRNGCCGGSASVPVARPGRPHARPDATDMPYPANRWRSIDVAGLRLHVAVGLAHASLTIDADTVWRWGNLTVEGVPLGASGSTRPTAPEPSAPSKASRPHSPSTPDDASR